MYRGYIRVWRKSLDSQVWQSPALWQLWCYCLLRANHKPCWVSAKTGRGSTQIYLEAGQFIFGSKQAAKDLKQKWQTTYKRLMKLKNMGNLKTQSKTHFTIVTICNWEHYQNKNNFDNNQNENPSKTQVKQTRMYLNNKNKYFFVENSIEFQLADLLLKKILERKSDFKQPDLQSWVKHIDYIIRQVKEVLGN